MNLLYENEIVEIYETEDGKEFEINRVDETIFLRTNDTCLEIDYKTFTQMIAIFNK